MPRLSGGRGSSRPEMAGDLHSHLRQRKEPGDRHEDAEEGVGDEERSGGGGEQPRPDGEGHDLGAPVQEVGHRKLEQHDHETVADEEEPYLSIRYVQEVFWRRLAGLASSA